jgi:lipid A 3-O-deacylase
MAHASVARHALAMCLAALAAAAASETVRADDKSHISLLEENDSLYFNSDKHYTQGFLLSYLGPDIRPGSSWGGAFGLFGRAAPGSPGGAADQSRHYALEFGQSLFTPKNLGLRPPDSHDRPYAGWIYVGASLLQDTDKVMLENLELQLGAVGPVALGRQTQNTFHQFIGKDEARGWGSEIQNEPGIVLSYERHWRLPLPGSGIDGVDFVPEAGATIGNIFTYGETGGLLRIGKNLQADFGPARIRPALSGSDYFNGNYIDGDYGYYFFAGTQGRVVGQNIFLDGNTFRSSRNVSKKSLVGDLQAGFSFFTASAWRLDFSVVRRSEEFQGQATPDVIGTAALSFSW